MSVSIWMRLVVLGSCVFAFIAGCVHSNAGDRPVQIVLLGGQSNMVGAGNFEAIDVQTRARIDAVADRVQFSLEPAGIARLGYTPNIPSEKYAFTQRFGPEIMIGVTLAERYPDREFLLVKTAQGGTALYGAWNPVWSAQQAAEVENTEMKRTTRFYAQHIAHVRSSMAQLKQQGRRYDVVGAAWMQGENDAAKEVSAKSYASNFATLIASYRRDLEVADMAFVAGQINSHYGRFAEGPKMVRQAVLDVAENDQNVGVVPTVFEAPWTDFPKHDDQVHYNTQGQLRLGTALGEKLIALLED